MNQYDAERVWERVKGEAGGPAAEPLAALLAGEIRVFQQLGKKLPAAQALQARQLSLRFQQQLACLRGMQVLIAGALPRPRQPQVSQDPPDLLLRQSYAQSLRLRTEYEARRGDPVYGPVFRLLASQMPEISAGILSLLGSLRVPG